jgi:hypothetical protein
MVTFIIVSSLLQIQVAGRNSNLQMTPEVRAVKWGIMPSACGF